MFIIFPDKPRSKLHRLIMWPVLLVDIWRFFDFRLSSFKDSLYWANQSLYPAKTLGDVSPD